MPRPKIPPLKQCAFLTMQDIRGFFCYDQLAIEPLKQLGWDVKLIPWNEDAVDWNEFDAVVIRSPWDYHRSPAAFLEVLATIDGSDARLLNPLHICC